MIVYSQFITTYHEKLPRIDMDSDAYTMKNTFIKNRNRVKEISFFLHPVHLSVCIIGD